MKRLALAMTALCICVLGQAAILADDKDKPTLSDTSLGAPAPQGATVLLSKDQTGTWVQLNGDALKWTVEDGVMTVKPGSGTIKSKDSFKSFQLHVEFNVPYMPKAKGQGRGNSGVYMQGVYELQVLDSYGLKLQDNDCGAIYKQITPSVNACKPPLQWQTYDVTFRSAEVQDDKVTKKARITVVHNGVKTIDDKEIQATPGGISMVEGKAGPFLLQDHGNLVQYRNIWVKPIE